MFLLFFIGINYLDCCSVLTLRSKVTRSIKFVDNFRCWNVTNIDATNNIFQVVRNKETPLCAYRTICKWTDDRHLWINRCKCGVCYLSNDDSSSKDSFFMDLRTSIYSRSISESKKTFVQQRISDGNSRCQ